MRISAQQKNAMLTIHFIELKHGLLTAVHTSFLRKLVGQSLCKELSPNHFLVGLRSLANNGFLTYSKNECKRFNASAKESENVWQLTNIGRMYAETLHSARMRPKRTYKKRSKE